MDNKKKDDIRSAVRKNYAKVSESQKSGCCSSSSSCCDTSGHDNDMSRRLGYSPEDIAAVPEGADMGLGCGNPQAIADLEPGETVLDLGSGGGFDCFLAARSVDEDGYVIGVDMTPEMITKSRRNAEKGGFGNVEFRLGELEHLPVADETVDVIISNCVINLSPDKEQVFAEAYRVLKPGGRLAVSDVVAVSEMPESIKGKMANYTGCVAGASTVPEIETMLNRCGFDKIKIRTKMESRNFIREWIPGSKAEDYIVSATIKAIKPSAVYAV
jgi:ubiquinone/menaquinone biosynthesis C-methylase UbiE